MTALGGDVCVIVTRSPLLDGGGHPVTNALGIVQLGETRKTVAGCSFEYTGGTESNSNVNPTELDGRAFMPPGEIVTANDAIEFRGLSHEVQTPPRLWTDELGRPDHLLVIVRHSEG